MPKNGKANGNFDVKVLTEKKVGDSLKVGHAVILRDGKPTDIYTYKKFKNGKTWSGCVPKPIPVAINNELMGKIAKALAKL